MRHFDVLERAARTFVQGFLAVVTVQAFTTVDITLVHQLEVGALAGAYSLLTSFAVPPRGA